MEKLIKELKQEVIDKFLKDGDLDKPYLIRGKDVFSKQRIIDEIENDTVEGRGFISSLVMLTLDLFDRGKKTIPEYKKV